MNRTDRLLGVLLELQRRKRVRAEDLAATFETSKRTIYRDIQALCETGVPIIAQAGLGYSLVEGYFLPPLSFSVDEATMLLLGSSFAAQSFDAQYRDAADSASRKIEAVLSADQREDVAYVQNSIALIASDSLEQSATKQLLSQLRRAIIERRTVRFHYHTRYPQDGQIPRNTREADPYGLVHFGGAWYLISFCHLRQANRNFKLDRMSELNLLEQTFQRPANFSMQSPKAERRNLTVQVLFDAEVAPWVKELRGFFVSEMRETPYGLLVTLQLHTEDEVVPWLLSWGYHVRVIEPQSVRKRIAEEAEKILQQYTAAKPRMKR
ncbi:MAG: YafY family transcriptional regulator [Acidobacteria bacterium]|nr:YafY family transcriptional regulator [Acidobacteriota bacterium]